MPIDDAPVPMGLEANQGQAKAGVLFQLRGLQQSIAVDAQGIAYSPLGVRVDFLGGNLNPTVSMSDPLAGTVNVYAGGVESKWLRAIRLFNVAKLTGVYPGVDVSYRLGTDGAMTMRLDLAVGVDLAVVRFAMPQAVRVELTVAGLLSGVIRDYKGGQRLQYAVPLAMQGSVARAASWKTTGMEQFAISVDGRDVQSPLSVEFGVVGAEFESGKIVASARGAGGERYVVASRADGAWRDAPFPDTGWQGCGASVLTPEACTDVMVAKYSAAGDLVWASYLEGERAELAAKLLVGQNGSLLVGGTTSSTTFAVTQNAMQRTLADPVTSRPSSAGDWFLARLNLEDGALVSSTYWGGVELDEFGEMRFGPDASVYVLPKYLTHVGRSMPTSGGALQRACARPICAYVARFDGMLSRLIFATFLPGGVAASTFASDGSVYFAGGAQEGFPVTATAYQRNYLGNTDGILGRLDAGGGRLIFATYLGTIRSDSIFDLAVAPDGSAWVDVGSSDPCCAGTEHSLLRVDALGEKVLVRKNVGTNDLFVDVRGRLHVLTIQPLTTVGRDALSAGFCGEGYLILGSDGEEIYSTNLPQVGSYAFKGVSAAGRPTFWANGGVYEIDETQEGVPFASCLVDAAFFFNFDETSPGAIVTIWGSRMGPEMGVAYKLENGKVPTELGGTRLLVDGKPAPLLYVSAGQVNAILPYDRGPLEFVPVQIERAEGSAPAIRVRLVPQGITLFAGAVLNEDGLVNSPKNPAKKGAIVVFYGTGGGATDPASVAGEVTPLELRRLAAGPTFGFGGAAPTVKPEYAGAAPGLLAGVSQFNVRLPATITELDPTLPKGTIQVQVVGFYGRVLISVEQ